MAVSSYQYDCRGHIQTVCHKSNVTICFILILFDPIRKNSTKHLPLQQDTWIKLAAENRF